LVVGGGGREERWVVVEVTLVVIEVTVVVIEVTD
jgi:hypothetical protein